MRPRYTTSMNKQLIFIFLLLLSIPLIVLHTGCANIIPPEGGPKDSLPPVLISSNPKDSMLNFKGNTITLNFDEYVLLDNNLQANLVVSPNPNTQPFVSAKLRTVTIKLKDTLQPNTTYSINLGKALKDVNESNVFKNFTYVFSTGDQLAGDSIRGKVLLAETGAIDSTLIVVLHKNLDDTSVEKNKPDYFTRIDGKGNFTFRYLPKTEFNLFVLPDDYLKKYDDSTKLFAFINKSIVAGSDTQSLSLYAYQQEKPKAKTVSPTAQTTAPAKEKIKKVQEKKLNYKTSLDGNEQDLLSNLSLQFDTKIATYDTIKIIFTDTNYQRINDYSFIQDTSLTKFLLTYNWKEDQYFKLILQQDAFADSAGVTLAKADTLNFKTKSETNYGSIRLRFTNLEVKRNPVLLFIQNNAIVNAIPLTGNELYRKLFKPGEYELRILYDDNSNGIWDPGNYHLKKQPEIVIQVPRQITIKTNWDNEVNISL